jgi:hypothetical protein
MTELEKEIERKLTAMVKRHGGRCLKWVCPGWAGVPDRILLFPGGLVFFVETKRPKGGRLAALQRKWQEWLTELGFFAGVAWSVEDVAALEIIVIESLRR